MGIIRNGEVVYTRTLGELRTGDGEKIDNATLFKIASNSKAMTAALLARLVDRGLLRWDDPVITYLPQFRMHDPWVTQQMQVRDLLIHNSGLGLGAGDLMLWPEPNRFTRADIIAGLQHLKPTHSFRAAYAYDNLLYVVAGEVAAAAGGAPYEELVKRELFQPLGLSRCQVGEWNRVEVGNVAQPHMRTPQGNVQKLLGDFWASGLDEAAVEADGSRPIAPLLDRINAIKKPKDVAPAIAALHQVGVPVTFNFSPDVDLQALDRHIGYFMQGGLGLPDPAYYTREDADTRVLHQARLRYRLRIDSVPVAP